VAFEKRTGKRGTTYRVRFYDENGERQSQSFTGPGARQRAYAFDGRWRQEKLEGAGISYAVGELTIAELSPDWFKEWKKGKPTKQVDEAADVHAFYILGRRWVIDEAAGKGSWQFIGPQLGSIKLKNLTAIKVEQWRDELIDDGCGLERLRKAMGYLQQIIDRAKVKGWRYNVARDVKKPAQGRRKKVVPPEVDQTEAIRAEFRSLKRDESVLLVSLLSGCGLRPGELFGVEIDKHLHLEGKHPYIEIEQRVSGDELLDGTKSPNWPWRSVDLLPYQADELREYLERRRRRTGFLFEGPRKAYWTESDYRSWRRYCWRPLALKHALLSTNPYSMRHQRASLGLASGETYAEISEQLGNGQEQVARTYAHVLRSLKGKPRINRDKYVRAARAKAEQAHPIKKMRVVGGGEIDL
jgi:integrase